MEQEARKLIGQKFLGFILALLAACLCAIFGVLNEWSAGLIAALYATLAGANAAISRGYAHAQGVMAGAGKKPEK
jgi:hypothetical protein